MLVKPALFVHGMHGLGDNLHQRALLRQLMPRHEVTLESSWVAPYHDLVRQGLKIVHKPSRLRTQAKNAAREAALFSQDRPPRGASSIRVWYRPEEVRRQRSVLGAMCAATCCDEASADFRLPIPADWAARAAELIRQWAPSGEWWPEKPILIYRPLVERTEWGGCATRNPDHAGYAALFKSLRDRFFVVSIADLVPGVEWMVGEKIDTDVELHEGELDFEVMAALFARAAIVFCSPGFAVILGQATGTPVICSFGRYERAYSFSAGARFAPYLGIEPINPCDDFNHDDSFDKTIDVAAAIGRAAVFAAAAAERHTARAAAG